MDEAIFIKKNHKYYKIFSIYNLSFCVPLQSNQKN